MNIYQSNGYKDRTDYLKTLASDYDVPVWAIAQVAQLLGPEEDFDGLIVSIEDDIIPHFEGES